MSVSPPYFNTPLKTKYILLGICSTLKSYILYNTLRLLISNHFNTTLNPGDSTDPKASNRTSIGKESFGGAAGTPSRFWLARTLVIECLSIAIRGLGAAVLTEARSGW
jgi:hypothetical protein